MSDLTFYSNLLTEIKDRIRFAREYSELIILQQPVAKIEAELSRDAGNEVGMGNLFDHLSSQFE